MDRDKELIKTYRELYSLKKLLKNVPELPVKLSRIPYGSHYGLEEKIISLKDFISQRQNRISISAYQNYLLDKVCTFYNISVSEKVSKSFEFNVSKDFLHTIDLPYYLFSGQEIIPKQNLVNLILASPTLKSLIEILHVKQDDLWSSKIYHGTHEVNNSSIDGVAIQQYLGPIFSGAPYHRYHPFSIPLFSLYIYIYSIN